MAILHIVGGEKGGVGKSFFSKLLIHFYHFSERELEIFDADTSTSDVYDLYGGTKGVDFDKCNPTHEAYDVNAADINVIYEAAIKKDVVVNLPANCQANVKYWLENTVLFDLEAFKEDGVRLILWFVSTGLEESFIKCRELVEKFNGNVDIILVKNLGRGKNNWITNQDNKIYKKLNESSILEFELPALAASEVAYINSNKLTYAQYLSCERSRLMKRRVTGFLSNFNEQLKDLF